MIRQLTIACVFLAVATAPLKADVIYTFVGTDANFGPPLTVGFQLSVPTFVNPPLDSGQFGTFGCGQLTSTTNLFCAGNITNTVQLGNQDNFSDFRPPNSAIVAVIDSNNALADFTFPAGALGSVGVYTANGTLLDTGTLTVTQTPEPSTLVLLLTGLGLCSYCRLKQSF